ncbi:MAG: NYN domain-containing protein [Dehalococcoidales bacterium]
MHKIPVNYAFIDGQNFYKSVQEIQKELEVLEVELDLNKFRIHLMEKYAVKIAYYFVGYIPKNKPLYAALERQGYELKFKEVAVHEDGIKGNVDVNLTLQSLIVIDNYEKAVLITSDGDYACLVEYLHSKGKFECLIACSRGSCSYLLRKLHDRIKIFYLDDIIRDLYMRKETS